MKNIASAVAMVLVVGLVCAASIAAQAVPQTQTSNPAQQAREEFVRAYRIGPGDLLEISVFEVPELSQEVRVEEDGSLTLPLLGRVMVNGMTQEGVVQRLTELLQAKYVKNPQVTIFIREYKNQQVAVLGAVENAGSYELVGRRNLLQMISMAGGFTDTAGNEVFILREGPDGDSRTIAIDRMDLMMNQDLNVTIEPNDVINVPVDREVRVFVMGRVNTPGPVTARMSEGITLLRAIAGAGGLAEGAKQTAIQISRKNKSGQEVKFKVNLKDILKGKTMDLRLQEGDVVFVPESFW